MPFAKLDSGIVNSSIWNEPLATRILWITILALKDKNGFVPCARSGLQRAANIDKESFDNAILSLESPDPDSRTQEYEGRRISKIEGGWIVLNHEKYRLHDDIHREKTRERVKKHRDKIKDVTQCNVTDAFPSVSVSVSESVLKEDHKKKTFKPIEIPEHLKKVWPDYLEMRKKIKKTMTENAQKLGLSQLSMLSPDNDVQVKIVEQSIFNSWQGLFPLKENVQSQQSNYQSKTDHGISPSQFYGIKK